MAHQVKEQVYKLRIIGLPLLGQLEFSPDLVHGHLECREPGVHHTQGVFVLRPLFKLGLGALHHLLFIIWKRESLFQKL